MAFSLDATVGGATSNSYATEAEASAYFDNMLYADAWDCGGATTHEKALVQATSILERLNYSGSKTDTIQVLQWPRSDTFDYDAVLISSTTIPENLKKATYEIAYEILNTKTRDLTNNEDDITEYSIDGMKVKVKNGKKSWDMNLPTTVLTFLERIGPGVWVRVRQIRILK